VVKRRRPRATYTPPPAVAKRRDPHNRATHDARHRSLAE
jgi:hypothetical protein